MCKAKQGGGWNAKQTWNWDAKTQWTLSMIVSCFAERKVCIPIINIQMQAHKAGFTNKTHISSSRLDNENDAMQKAVQRIMRLG